MEQEPSKNSKDRIVSIIKSMQDGGECRIENDTYNRLKELEELFYKSEKRYHALEEQLRGRASQLEAIIETITDGLIVYDQKGNIIQTNLATRHLLNKKFKYHD